MIHHIQGDLLKSDCDVICHQANCQQIFGGGIAAQIRVKLPGAYQADLDDKRTPSEKLGSYSYTTSNINQFKVVFNLYGQLKISSFTRMTNYEALQSAMRSMLIKLGSSAKQLKIGMPYMVGCALGGGDWNIVYKIIEDVFNEFEVDCYLYEFTP